MTDPCEGAQKASINVDPGVCRFITTIKANYMDGKIYYEITTDCPHVKALAEEIKEGFGLMDIMQMPFISNPVYERCGTKLKHSACPIPSAMIKSAEVSAGFALKRAVKFEYEG
jgi:hypothetical protein